ncbi:MULTISPECIES: hypothetical protein [unclassified Synechococcus]|uniref:hypothetical protein n=1 Tax=unclassified Synechococcus TaxID=2626047 RepID=UPI0020016159|nr:hypothetical protein [Synechococcus sp. A10-1-5-1]UPM51260.1 hypothetical protein MY494_05755 [Synechococcus sp. A10-1-5-1]
MPLLPRWRFMTDEAKALTKRVAFSALALALAALMLRALLPWMVLVLALWGLWRWTRR